MRAVASSQLGGGCGPPASAGEGGEREEREGEGERSSVFLQCVSMSESVAQVYNYRSGIVTR